MRVLEPNQDRAERPGVAPGLAWTAMALFALLGYVFISAAVGPFNKSWPVGLVSIAIYVVVFFCIQAACHPLRKRTDQTQCWRERFPTHDEREVQRFLEIVGESLGIREARVRRIRPDDRPEKLTQEVFCGDGMDLVELMMAIENAYALELPDSFLEKATTLGDLFDYVTRHSPGRPQPAPPPSHATDGKEADCTRTERS